MCDNIFFLTTSTSVGPRAPAGRPGSRQSRRWPHQPDWVIRNPGPDWTVPKGRPDY